MGIYGRVRWILLVAWLVTSPVYTQLVIDVDVIKDVLEGRNLQENSSITSPKASAISVNSSIRHKLSEDSAHLEEVTNSQDLSFVATKPLQTKKEEVAGKDVSSAPNEESANQMQKGHADNHENLTYAENQDTSREIKGYSGIMSSEDMAALKSQAMTNFRLLQASSPLTAMVKKAQESAPRVDISGSDLKRHSDIVEEEESTQRINSIDYELEFLSNNHKDSSLKYESIHETGPYGINENYGDLPRNSHPRQEHIFQRRDDPSVQSLLQYVLQQHEEASEHHEQQPMFAMPLPADPTEAGDIDTFNIVITKNLTGGQSQHTVQHLPDAEVNAMLLNTTITSVSTIQSLRDVVNKAISNAMTSNPVAFEEALAQVVERPGHIPTVNVVNSTIPNLRHLEDTINSLLGTDVIYEEDRQTNTAYGYIPIENNSSVVSRLFNNTIGVNNLNLNSTSKTNIVNIFIINIIGGTENNPVTEIRQPSTPYSPSSGPTNNINIMRPFPGTVVDPNLVTSSNMNFIQPTPESPIKSQLPVGPSPSNNGITDFFVSGVFAPSPPPSGYIPLPHEIGPPAIPPKFPPLMPISSSFLPPQGINEVTSEQGSGAPGTPLETLTNESTFSASTNAPGTHGGITLNHNYVLNLLPEFVKATTIPPVVPLYNTSIHNTLGQKPSVLGLLPNQVFYISRPLIDSISNDASGGIIRLANVGNPTDYFSGTSPPFYASNGDASQQQISNYSQGSIQYPAYDNSYTSQPSPIPNNPYPFRQLIEHLRNEQEGQHSSPQFYSNEGATENTPQFIQPALGIARMPINKQSPLYAYNVVNMNERENEEMNLPLVELTENNTMIENATLLQLQNPVLQTGITRQTKPKKEMQKEEATLQTKIARVAKDAVDAAGRMDDVMKAVAIGALPSGIAFATALWPYWAPAILGKRRKRDLETLDEARAQSDISVDWLSILTGTKYKDARPDFPSAWNRATLKRKNDQYKQKLPSSLDDLGEQSLISEPHVASEADITTYRTMLQESAGTASTEISVRTTGKEEADVIAKENDNLKESTPELNDKTTPKRGNSSLSERTESTTGRSDNKDLTFSALEDGIAKSEISTTDFIQTTEKATTVKRSTPANPNPITTKENVDESVKEVKSTLTSESSVPELVTPVNDQDGKNDKEEGNPADVALVTNFLYSALNGWNDGKEAVPTKEIPITAKEEIATITIDDEEEYDGDDEVIDLQLSTSPPQKMASGTNSPIVFINGVPMIADRTPGASSVGTTLGLRPIYTLQQTPRPSIVTPRPAVTTPLSSTQVGTFPNRQPGATSKPTIIINNQAITTAGSAQANQKVPGVANIQVQTAASQTVRFPIIPEWVTRRTTTPSPTTSPTTTTTPSTTTAPTTTTTPTTTTPTTTTPTTTTPTTTTSATTTTLPPVRDASPATTTTSTTTTTTAPTTTTTTPAPGFFDSITSVLSNSDGQFQQAVGFVGSVAVYGAAALMPFWLPIVLGKRRRRDLQVEDDLQEILDAIQRTQNPPGVTESPTLKDIKDTNNEPSRKVTSDKINSDADLINLYKHFPSLKKLAQYLKKDLLNRKKSEK